MKLWLVGLGLHGLYTAAHFGKHLYWRVQTRTEEAAMIAANTAGVHCRCNDARATTRTNDGGIVSNLVEARDSPIAGVGLFSMQDLDPGACLFVVATTAASVGHDVGIADTVGIAGSPRDGPASSWSWSSMFPVPAAFHSTVPTMTPIGKLVNHAWSANLAMVSLDPTVCCDGGDTRLNTRAVAEAGERESGEGTESAAAGRDSCSVETVRLGAVTIRHIASGEELLFNYAVAPWYIRMPMPWWW